MSYFTDFSSPHLHQVTSVQRVMQEVTIALVPGILLSAWYFGPGVLVHCVISVLFALVLEAIMLVLRKRPVKLFLSDGSAIVTGLLFALTVSPFAPWWVDFWGILFAIVIVKHLFGGIGNNIFNPAMAGYVFVLLNFSAELTIWPALRGAVEHQAGLMQILSIIFSGEIPVSEIDSLSGATPLDFMKTQISGMSMISEIRTAPMFGSLGGKGWEWIAFAWLAGGVWLIFRRIIGWQMPVFFLVTLFITSLLFYWYNSDIYLPPLFHLFTGGTFLAAFFIVTDPVTAATTPRGRLIYVAGIGLLTYFIRSWGGYPDGIAFAVIIMNAAVPLIDLLTRPRVFGEK